MNRHIQPVLETIFAIVCIFQISCTSLPGKLFVKLNEIDNSVEACLNYLAGKKDSIHSVLGELSASDQQQLLKANGQISSLVPVFSYFPYNGTGGLAYSFGGNLYYYQTSEKILSSSEVMDWKCVEKVRLEIDNQFEEASFMYAMNPNNVAPIWAKVKRASDVYSQLSKLIINRSEFLIGYLYLPVIYGMSSTNQNYNFACQFLDVAGPTAILAYSKSSNTIQKQAFLSNSYMIVELSKRSFCK
ncbi:hypothetical protein [Leptospira neocaledonica]|uniref:Uncharacterized protein n=1 Tax=Leptospira neocaledonica TaxID=2023192 RepID=A0A2N0A382_9LEPT|nr:hypothetical protein [Leptospira neocaledonica]PJZ78796.1 hypothetical protein CH365_00760 [Leptospira neocaledonica]